MKISFPTTHFEGPLAVVGFREGSHRVAVHSRWLVRKGSLQIPGNDLSHQKGSENHRLHKSEVKGDGTVIRRIYVMSIFPLKHCMALIDLAVIKSCQKLGAVLFFPNRNGELTPLTM